MIQKVGGVQPSGVPQEPSEDEQLKDTLKTNLKTFSEELHRLMSTGQENEQILQAIADATVNLHSPAKKAANLQVS